LPGIVAGSLAEFIAMKRLTLAVVGLILPSLLVGCAQNPYVLQGQVQTLQTEQASLARRNEEFKSRAETLDRNNQELETFLAQERQQKRLLEDQLAAMRDQLNTTNTQLARAKSEVDQFGKKTEALEAGLKKQAGATIRVNSSLKNSLPPLQIQGVEVRQDADVIRVELPGNRLFEPGGARLLPDGLRLIDEVARKLGQTYPDQMIGVEGHTSSDPIPAGRWTGHHQLSVAMAMAVSDQISGRGIVAARQLFLAGHGANHPVASNATQAGKDRNYRVELVVYPEKPTQ
jgi:flagellar motor protein MotB